MPMQPQTWTVNGLSVELGEDRRTLAKRLADVPPAETKGKTKRWRMTDALAALGKSRVDPVKSESESAARARLTRARADIHEATASQMAGDLVPIEQIAEAWTQIITRLRGSLISLPNRAAPLVEHEDNIETIRESLTTIVHEALEELASAELKFDPDGTPPEETATDSDQGSPRPRPRRPNGAGRAKAPAPSDRQSVGRSE